MAGQTRSSSQNLARGVEYLGRNILGRGYGISTTRDATGDGISISVTRPMPQVGIIVSPEVVYRGGRYMADLVAEHLHRAKAALQKPGALVDFVSDAAIELAASGERHSVFVSHKDFSDLINTLTPDLEYDHKMLHIGTQNGSVRILPAPFVGNYSSKQDSNKRDIWWEVTKAMRAGDVGWAKQHAKDALVELLAEEQDLGGRKTL